jgi:hypothetical protein
MLPGIRLATSGRSRKRFAGWRSIPESLEVRSLLSSVVAEVHAPRAVPAHSAPVHRAAAGTTGQVHARDFLATYNDLVGRVFNLQQQAPMVMATYHQENFTNESARLAHRLAMSSEMILERKPQLTQQYLKALKEADGQATFKFGNELAGQFNDLERQTAEAGVIQSRAFNWLRTFDTQKAVPFLQQANGVKQLVLGYTKQASSLPEKMRDLDRDIEAFKNDPKVKFLGTLSPDVRARQDKLNGRAIELHDLKQLVEYSLKKVASVEEIDAKIASLTRVVQLRTGTWQRVHDELNIVTNYLGRGRISFLESNTFVGSSLRAEKEVQALTARYLVTFEPL